MNSAPAPTCPRCGHDVARLEGIHVVLEENRVWFGERSIKLQGREAEILYLLVDAALRLATKDYVMRNLYAVEAEEPSRKCLDVYMCRLRRVIVRTGYTIETVRGRGWRLVPPAEEGAEGEEGSRL